MNPCSAIQKSLYIFERYLLPVSGTRVTTRFGFVCCRQYRSAPARSVPVDEPPKIPSLCKSSRAVAKLSASSISNASVTNDMSAISGMKSSPMPSTAQLPDSTSLPVFTYSYNTEPVGSAKIISIPRRGFTRLKKRPRPVSVPPEPTPTTTASTSCRICSQISGRSEEHTSELQSRGHLVCRLLLEKKN